MDHTGAVVSFILSSHFILTHPIRSWPHRMMKSLIYLDFIKTETFCASDDTLTKAKDNQKIRQSMCREYIHVANEVRQKMLNIVSHQRKANQKHKNITTSYYKMALIKTTMLTRMGRNWNLHTLLVEMQNNGVTLENSLAVPQNITYWVTIWSSNSAPRYIPKRIKNICFPKNLYMNDYCSIIHNCPQSELKKN